jgi:hypothetical protein
MSGRARARTVTGMPEPTTLRATALAGATGALICVATALLAGAGVVSGAVTPTSNTVDLIAFTLILTGLGGFAASGAARGWLARIGLVLAFAGLGLYLLAAAWGFADRDAGETLHPISVPLTGVGMLLTGIATLRTGQWTGWVRFAPLLCGIVPFVVELPGFIGFGDSKALNFFIAATWSAWLIFGVAQWDGYAGEMVTRKELADNDARDRSTAGGAPRAPGRG